MQLFSKIKLSLLHPYQNVSFSSDYFSLRVQPMGNDIKLIMKMNNSLVNTRDIPLTFDILRYFLPSILLCECFNENNTPFYEELRHTEIGHLFEHILLEYLCELKLARGHKTAEYSGVTTWNWKQDMWGTFHITIRKTGRDFEILQKGLEKTVQMVNLIIRSTMKKSSISLSSSMQQPGLTQVQ